MRTFETQNGYKLNVREYNTRFNTQLVKKYPRPAIPTQRVEVAPGVFEDVPNPALPEYQTAMLEWKLNFFFAMTAVMIDLFVQYKEIDFEEVKHIRGALMQNDIDVSKLSDKNIFVQHIAIADDVEMSTLLDFIRETKVTAEGVSAAKESFRD